MHKLTVENEHQLRTMVQLTVLEKQQPGAPLRGTRRIDWIELALVQLKPRLGKAAYSRLVSALAMITGIEALLVLRDIRGLSDGQAIQACQWMAKTLLRETMRESGL
jgi:hypothetical protein